MKKKNNRMLCLLFISGLMMPSLASCDHEKDFKEAEEEAIQQYLEANPSLDFELKPSGLYYLNVIEGTGRATATHDTAYVFYSEEFLDGSVNYSNMGTDDTLIFPVNEGYLNVKGFDEGITYMKEGGTSKLLTPSDLAYGSKGNLYIYGYTPLIYNIRLVKVKPGPEKK